MNRRDVLIIFVFAVVLFTVGLPCEFIGFQTRFSVFAREMLVNGPSLFPTVYNVPYTDYSSAATLPIYYLSKALGQVTPFTVALPTALISSLVLVFTYLIGATYSRKWGLLAVMFCLMTLIFVDESRGMSMDMYVALAVTVCFYIVHSAKLVGRKVRLGFIPFVCIAGYIFRGSHGLVLPALVVGCYFLWEREYLKFVLTGVIAAVLLAVCIWTLLTLTRMVGGDELAERMIADQMGRRVTGRAGKFYFFYYWYRSFGEYSIVYPVAIFVTASLFRPLLKARDGIEKLLGHLVIWTLVVMGIMSVPGTKALRYILPVTPALALLASYLFAAEQRSDLWNNVRFHMVRFFATCPVYAIICAICCVIYSKREGIEYDWNLLIVFGLLMILVAVGIKYKPKVRTFDTGEVTLTLVGALAFMVVYIGVISPMYYQREETSTFVQSVESQIDAETDKLVYYMMGPDREDVKYAANVDRLLTPGFVREFEKVLEYGASSFFITHKKYFKQLTEDQKKTIEVVAVGNLGHKEAVAFQLSDQ